MMKACPHCFRVSSRHPFVGSPELLAHLVAGSVAGHQAACPIALREPWRLTS